MADVPHTYSYSFDPAIARRRKTDRNGLRETLKGVVAVKNAVVMGMKRR